MKLIIGAGGSGGHIIPAIAVANELHIMNWEILFIGNNNSMEQNLVKQYAYTFYPIKVQKIYRKFTVEHMRFPFLFVYSLLLCLQYLHKEKPDGVFVTGGYVSAPVAAAAIILRINLYCQDGNSYPGLTTRIFGRYAKRIFIASEKAKEYLNKDICILSGNPLLGYHKIDKADFDYKCYNLESNKKTVLIIGGSQGSEVINQVVDESIDDLLELRINIMWQTGKNHYLLFKQKHAHRNGVYCFDFTSKLNDFYQIADVAVSRAGALSIAELEEHRVPAIFIPLPTAAENHQYANAMTQQAKNVCFVIEQKNLSKNTLLEAIKSIMSDIESYKDSFNSAVLTKATKVVAETINLDYQNGG